MIVEQANTSWTQVSTSWKNKGKNVMTEILEITYHNCLETIRIWNDPSVHTEVT